MQASTGGRQQPTDMTGGSGKKVEQGAPRGAVASSADAIFSVGEFRESEKTGQKMARSHRMETTDFTMTPAEYRMARNRLRTLANRYLSHEEREVRDLAVWASWKLGSWEFD